MSGFEDEGIRSKRSSSQRDSVKAEIQQLRDIARRQGWRVEMTEGNHWKFVPPAKDKPIVIVPGTSVSRSGIRNAKAALRRSGLMLEARDASWWKRARSIFGGRQFWVLGFRIKNGQKRFVGIDGPFPTRKVAMMSWDIARVAGIEPKTIEVDKSLTKSEVRAQAEKGLR